MRYFICGALPSPLSGETWEGLEGAETKSALSPLAVPSLIVELDSSSDEGKISSWRSPICAMKRVREGSSGSRR